MYIGYLKKIGKNEKFNQSKNSKVLLFNYKLIIAKNVITNVERN